MSNILLEKEKLLSVGWIPTTAEGVQCLDYTLARMTKWRKKEDEVAVVLTCSATGILVQGGLAVAVLVQKRPLQGPTVLIHHPDEALQAREVLLPPTSLLPLQAGKIERFRGASTVTGSPALMQGYKEKHCTRKRTNGSCAHWLWKTFLSCWT